MNEHHTNDTAALLRCLRCLRCLREEYAHRPVPVLADALQALQSAADGWVCFFDSEPHDGQRVLVYSPELDEQVIACVAQAGKLVPLNPRLRAAWQAGAFGFAYPYWRLVPLLPVAHEFAGDAQTPEAPPALFEVGDKVILHRTSSAQPESVQGQFGSVGVVLQRDRFSMRQYHSYFVHFERSDAYAGRHWVGEEYLAPAHREAAQ